MKRCESKMIYSDFLTIYCTYFMYKSTKRSLILIIYLLLNFLPGSGSETNNSGSGSRKKFRIQQDPDSQFCLYGWLAVHAPTWLFPHGKGSTVRPWGGGGGWGWPGPATPRVHRRSPSFSGPLHRTGFLSLRGLNDICKKILHSLRHKVIFKSGSNTEIQIRKEHSASSDLTVPVQCTYIYIYIYIHIHIPYIYIYICIFIYTYIHI